MLSFLFFLLLILFGYGLGTLDYSSLRALLGTPLAHGVGLLSHAAVVGARGAGRARRRLRGVRARALAAPGRALAE